MRKENFIFLFIFSIIFPLFFSPYTYATRSRLSGMGELSIVIEDESNMINLWDFAGNPAGFLADEKGSVIKGDFLWDRYRITNLRYYDYHYHTYSRYNADGNVFNSRISSSFRRQGDFALAAEGNHFFRQSDFQNQKSELTYPEIFMVFSKSLNALTAVGADLGYVEYTLQSSYKPSRSVTRFKTKYFRAEIGAGRRLSSEVTLAATLGCESVDSDEKFYLSDFHTFWVSVHSIVEIEQRLKLGFKTIFNLRRADFRYSLPGNEKYYFACLSLRAIYDLTSKLRMGLLFFHNELFSGFYYPLEQFFRPARPEAFAVGHWGIGCSYKFTHNTLVGLEYHFRNSSEPDPGYPDPALMHEALNLGVEAKPSEALSVRGGYIRTATNQNPVRGYPGLSYTWENALTLGFGYEPHEWNLSFDLSYRYSFKKFKQWYSDWDVESGKHTLSISFKKVL